MQLHSIDSLPMATPTASEGKECQSADLIISLLIAEETATATAGIPFPLDPSPKSVLCHKSGCEEKLYDGMSHHDAPCSPAPCSPASSSASRCSSVGSSVSFSHVSVRYYECTIGDHPSVNFGVPIALTDRWIEVNAKFHPRPLSPSDPSP